MKKLVSVFFLMATLTSNAMGQGLIQDPNNLLGDIDQFVDAQSFSDAFKINDSVTLLNQTCTLYNDGNGSYMECDSDYEDKTVIESTGDYALLNNNLAVLKSVYEKYDRNPVRFWFHTQKANLVQSFTKQGLVKSNITDSFLRLEKLTQTIFEVEGDNYDALKLNISFVMIADDGSEVIFPVYAIVARGLPFLGQVAEVGIDMEIDGHIFPPTMKIVEAQKN